MEEKKIFQQKSKKENLITNEHQKKESSKINKNIYCNSKIRNTSQNIQKNKTLFTKKINKIDSKNIASTKKTPESPNKLSSNRKNKNTENSAYDSPEDIVTSFERKPSDLKSPDTVSEDSFTSSFDENKLHDEEIKTDSRKNENINEANQKNKSNVFSGNELIYVDKIQDDDEDNNNELENKPKFTTGYIINSNNSNKKILISQKKNVNESKYNLKNASGEKIPYVPVNQRKILENKINKEKSLTASNNNINNNNNTEYKQHQKQFILKKKLHLNSEGSKSNKGMFTAQNNPKKVEIQKKKLFTSHNTIAMNTNQKMNTVKYNRYNNDKKLETDSDERYLKNSKNEINNSNENDKTNTNTNNTISNGGNNNDVNSNHKKNSSKNESINNNSNNFEILKQKNKCVLFTKGVNKQLALNSENSQKRKQTNFIKTSKSPTTKGNKIIYAPKKLGVIRVSSRQKTNHPIYNNMSHDPNKNLNDKIKNALSISTMNNNTYINTTYDQNRFFEMNNSFYFGFDKNNIFNNNIPTIDLNSVNGLNTSFDNANNSLNNNHLIYNGNEIKSCNNNSQSNIFDTTKRYSLNDYYERQTAKPLIHHNSSFDLNTIEQLHNFQNQSQLINLIGNNFLNNNASSNEINKTNTYKDPSNNILNMFNNNDNNNLNNTNVSLMNFEDLIILQEYLKQLIISLSKSKSIENECFELWNYYCNSSIYGQLEKLFKNSFESNEIKISINYFLMSIMTCYDYSFELNILNNTYITLGEILQLNYKNLMAICEHILNKTSNESLTNIWVMKLSAIVKESLFGDYQYIMNNGYKMSIVERVSFNTNIIVQKLRFLLKNFKTNKNEKLTKIFKKIREASYDEINNFFRDYILRICNINGSILASVYLRKNSNFRTLPAPYVRTKNNKPYSLVLDLDETLIHFKPKQNGEDGGILRIRPGINEFLDEVGKYYELIIFTTATQDYADVLIDAVEEDKIYFDHRLYREHAIIMDNDFVKDLTRIGRPIDKMLIVDNMPQNFRLQKENGIIIRAFWGEDSYDNALTALIPILVNIAKEGGDIRKGLVKYRDEIVKNVTSNISKQNI